MSRRVYLHVGTPKSGTSYLQDRFALNRGLLAAQGLDYVRTRTGDHFEAALDLIGDRWAGEEEAARGQWDALAATALQAPRDVLVSHEILAAAPAERAERALASFPHSEIHVVVTARDLGRQIPAEWQERVKHRGRREFTEFLKALAKNYPRTDWLMWFWRVQHLPRILETWGASLPRAQVHLVTVPHSGGPRGLLWERFAGVVGLDPGAAYAETETTNASLGGAEVTMLRKLNIELERREVTRDVYVELVRETIVKEVLARRSSSPRATVPPRRRPAVEAITEDWLGQIRASGIDVVGDLAELEPAWPGGDGPWPNPDLADPEQVAEAAIAALAHILDEIGTPYAEAGPLARLARRLRG